MELVPDTCILRVPDLDEGQIVFVDQEFPRDKRPVNDHGGKAVVTALHTSVKVSGRWVLGAVRVFIVVDDSNLGEAVEARGPVLGHVDIVIVIGHVR